MTLGVYSNRALDTVHPKLQRLIREVDKRLMKTRMLDLTVLCGHRGREEQDKAYAAGASSKPWPESLHNRLPSAAVDIAPYPLDWNDHLRFARLAGYVQAVADELGIEIRWGGDWDRDGNVKEHSFIDQPHFELTQTELNRP
jgi:peptidoglycan L-alanyl-D-glutamate endopeptidase CwlK